MVRPIGIDLFAGVGGMSLGFEQAGFDIAAAVEYDPIHAAAHKFNFPDCAVLARSVVELTGSEIRRRAGLGNQPIEVVFGGAPCQGFSLIGQRVLDDPRNSLVRDFIRIVKELDANSFVFENVKGLTVGKHRQFLDELIETFEKIGYRVQQPWRVLNAAAYGAPQNRERLILIGAKVGQPLAKYPKALFRFDKRGIIDGSLPRPPSCRDALDDLPDAESFEELKKDDSVEIGDWKPKSSYGALMRCDDSEGWYHGYKRKWNRAILSASARSEHTSISRRRFRETAPGRIEPISRFFKLPPDGLANTLRAGSDNARGAFTSPRPIHYQFNRCITVREMARLHGFPDWFRFHVTKWHGARQIGNAVPPPLARAIAKELISVTQFKPSKPRRIITLGAEPLLHMDMSEAARYWGIDVPIGRRDQKSGVRKRKQSEIEIERLELLKYA